jgi:hypothetical protein
MSLNIDSSTSGTPSVEDGSDSESSVSAVSRLSIEDVVVRLKNVGHIWGLTGTFQVGSCVTTFEGFDEIFTDDIFTAQREFLSKLPPSHPFYSLNNTIEETHASIDEPTDDVAEKIVAGQTVFVEAGSKDHLTFLVFATLKIAGETTHLLYKCNRGKGSDRISGVEVYQIKDLSKLNDALEFIEEDRNEENDLELFNHELNDLLKLEPLHGLVMKPQKTGNCTKASANAAFYALLFHTALQQCDQGPLKAEEMAHTTYKQFTKQHRVSSLLEVLQEPWHNDALLKGISQKIASSSRYSAAERASLLDQIQTKTALSLPPTESLEFEEDDDENELNALFT